MTDYTQHPIVLPPELVNMWAIESTSTCSDYEIYIATKAAEWGAQWGADQELEACCQWLGARTEGFPAELRAARRPKPPSLKEQALTALTWYTTGETILTKDSVDTIRRALEQLDD
jgi:hypothetical protein